MVRSVNVYANTRAGATINELKNNWSLWTKAKTATLQPGQTDLTIDFPVPLTACNLMIEYADFYENAADQASEKLMCPRCNRAVTDRSGICRQCRENAYQCRQCRNINYETLDAFLCIECGYCRYGRFDYTIVARPALSVERIENEEGRQKAMESIQKDLEAAHIQLEKLQQVKAPPGQHCLCVP